MVRSSLIVSLLLILICSVGSWLGASPDSSKDEYIPKDLDDAHETLLRDLSPDDIQKIKDYRTEEDMIDFDQGPDPGIGMRNGWGLWKGSRLARYFNKMGIDSPDDMSDIIMKTFWCRLHHQPFGLKERVAYYRAYWRANDDPPATAVTPGGHRINWVESWGAGTKTVTRQMHIGMDDSDQSFWVYEYDKGVYKPTPEMMERIKKEDYWKTTYPQLKKEQDERRLSAPSK